MKLVKEVERKYYKYKSFAGGEYLLEEATQDDYDCSIETIKGKIPKVENKYYAINQ